MHLRLVTMGDARRLFDWRNDDLTRSMSVSRDPVEWGGHVAWLERRLSRAEPDLYIAEAEGVPVGSIRFDGDEISYTVAPEHRGKGIAVSMLSEALRLFGPKTAHIKPENAASIRAAERSGHKTVLI